MIQLQKTVELIQEYLRQFRTEKRKIYMTSSFQTQSIPLLHIVSQYAKDVNIVFIDTGYLFPETYDFADYISNKFKLNLITVKSSMDYSRQMTNQGLFLYAVDTAMCCHINKVVPIDNLMDEGDVWISGVRRDQTSIRANMDVLEKDQSGVIRFHPILDWSSKNIYDYIKEHDLPRHPLEFKGYKSIGCAPCTQRSGNNRNGRWVGSKKTECGLHIKRDNV